MGQKVNPYGFRLGVIYPWKSNWYAKRDYAQQLHEDRQIRDYIKQGLTRAGISSVDIERKGDQIWVWIWTARPGIVIGRKGSEVDRIRRDLERLTAKRVDVKVAGHERDGDRAASRRPTRSSWRRASPSSSPAGCRSAAPCAVPCRPPAAPGALGVRVQCGGRLGGTEMSRREWYREGRVPLHTLRAKVDYGFSEAKTTFGRIGVKVWVYHGDEIPIEEQETARARARAKAGMPARGAGGASTGALITSPKDLVELEEEPVAATAGRGPAEEPAAEAEAAPESPVAETEPKTESETPAASPPRPRPRPRPRARAAETETKTETEKGSE